MRKGINMYQVNGLMQGAEQSGPLDGALGNLFSNTEGDTNFRVGVEMDNETIIKIMAGVLLVVLLAKRL